MKAAEFSAMVEECTLDGDYIDTINALVIKMNIDPAIVGRLLTSDLKSKVEKEAEKRNLLKK